MPVKKPTIPAPNHTTTKEKTVPETDGFWDDPSVRPAASSYMKFEVVGDHIAGTIAKLSKRVFNAGTPEERVAPEFTFVQPEDDDEIPSMTAGQVLLQQALWELRPVIGDHLDVTLARVEKRGAKTLKRFKIILTRKDGSVETIDQTED